MRFDILSLFPEMFVSPFQQSIIKRARERGILEIVTHNIRDYALGKHRVTDDAPYGGGGGMIMKIEPIDRALQTIIPGGAEPLVVLLSPQGKLFDQEIAWQFSHRPRLILICGRYEGIDERVSEHLVDCEISIGDFILTGGELAAMVVVDAVTRLLPGAIGNEEAPCHDSFAKSLLEHPHYTRPAEYKGWQIPDILLSGHQKHIEEWRQQEALCRTKARRPDLLEKSRHYSPPTESLSKKDKSGDEG